ncbi:MAG: F510_1955 family glycosylhydrolase [Dehalococcoidia bacterium]
MRMKISLTIAALVAALLAACGGDAPSSKPPGSAGVQDRSPELVHVHGLGLNAADQSLYVATHSGLYRLTEKGPELVGGRTWDVMGFTVRGPDHFIGGGHPSPEEIRQNKYPPLLGFIETTDGGDTWAILAMKGEVDLHALAVDDGEIYAVDSSSGRLLASPDGKTWEIRSNLTATSLAVEAKGRLLATTRAGLVESLDRGRTWKASADAPPLVLAAVEPGGPTWGVTADGAVHRNDGAGSWQKVGTVAGKPEALSASPGRLFAATDRGIFESTDGASWTTLYTTAE